MPARGRTSFNKRQKEQERKERNQQKLARRQGRKDQQAAVPAVFGDARIADDSKDNSNPIDMHGYPLSDADRAVSDDV
jgi:hypothetical protein